MKALLLAEFGDISALEGASIEDVAAVMLRAAKREVRNGQQFHAGNLVNGIASPHPGYPPQAWEQPSQYEIESMKAIAIEALGWLEGEKLIAPDPTGNYGGYYIITRLGQRVESREDMSSYAKRSYLPKEVLRDDIAEVALAPFLAGRYDEAVRAAFTRIEAWIRDAADYGHDQYGVAMVREAFAPGNKKDEAAPIGPLADPQLEFTEREAVAHLFAGAIGYIKNPLSHRELNIDDARVAASRILLANDLMNTLAAHVAKRIALGVKAATRPR